MEGRHVALAPHRVWGLSSSGSLGCAGLPTSACQDAAPKQPGPWASVRLGVAVRRNAANHEGTGDVQWLAAVAQEVSYDHVDIVGRLEHVARHTESWHWDLTARDGERLQQVADQLCGHVAAAIDGLPIGDICRVVDACVELHTRSPRLWAPVVGDGSVLMKAICARTLVAELQGFLTARSAARLLWSWGRLRVQEPRAVARVVAHVQRPEVARTLNVRDITMATWGLAKMHYTDPVFMAAMAEKVVAGGMIHQFNAREVANSAWAWAKLKVRDQVCFWGCHLFRLLHHDRL